MTPLDRWLAVVAEALDLDPATIDRDLVLDLTKDVAHGVARPAAPLTAYLVGVAVGRGLAPAIASDVVRRQIADWPSGTDAAPP